MKILLKILISGVPILAGYVIISLKVFHPHHRTLAVMLYVGGGIALFFALRGKWKQLGERRRLAARSIYAYAPHIIVAGLLLVCLRAAWVLMPVEQTALVSMSDEELRDSIERDLKSISIIRTNTDALLDTIEAGTLFGKDAVSFRADERERLKELWRDFMMDCFEYDLLKNSYRGFYQLDYSAKPDLHADAFFIALASLTSQYASAFRFVQLVGPNIFAEAVMNEETDEFSKNSYYRMKQRLTDADILVQLGAGAAYLQLVKRDLTAGEESVSRLESQIEDMCKAVGKRPKVFWENPLEFLERTAFKSWYPLQKNVALQMSCIRTTGRSYFIPPKAIGEYKRKLMPGDILLERRNWYMSNIGIPGFWPHVAFFVGTMEDIDRSFGGLSILEGKSASDYLRQRYPQACKALEAMENGGFPKSVIEAMKNGIVMTSVESSGHADYLAVLRPKVSAEDKFRAIAKALSYWGRPYDYNFDFATDKALVCSELVYKSFEESNDLDLEPSMINGRLLLPPNHLVRKFDEEFGTPREQLDFVLYLEGSEERQNFFERGVSDFRESWKKPKWDIMQE